MTGCICHDDNGVQCERDPGHKGKHAYDLAMGGQHEWTGGLVPAARIADLERAAETSRAEHAAALGLATARIRELMKTVRQLIASNLCDCCLCIYSKGRVGKLFDQKRPPS